MQAVFTLCRLAVMAALLAALFSSAPAAAAISMQAEYQQGVIAPDAEKVELVIRFKAPSPTPSSAGRSPLALALVIDRSGSMDAAGKLNYAKSAIINLMEQLNDKDVVALVAYNSQVQELFSAGPMTKANRQKVLRLVEYLEADGSTFLSGGLEAGFRQMEHADAPGQKRVILLSDGIANVGETDHSRLAALASRIRQKGVTLTAMGLGQDYDEDLMQLIAQRGGGNYYYIRRPKDADRYFASELKGVMAGVSKDITLTFTLNDNVLDVRVYGYTVERQGNEYGLDISDFYGDEERTMVMELTVKPEAGSPALDLGSLNLRYRSLSGEGAQETVVLPLRVEISPEPERRQASINQDAQALVLAARVDANYAKALDEAKAGNYEQAEAIVADNKVMLEQSPLTADSELLGSKFEAMELEERRMSAMAAAPAAMQEDYIKQARSRVYKAGQGKNNAVQMKEGSQGLEVELLQEALNQAGFYNGPVDGIFSPEVSAAVRRFQSAKGLSADGVAGPQTQEKLGLY
ncbi:MAG: VWA domain-containing protein [Desulfarculales bacterium]|nr:VWA domain-containing protein [Desulfarculales bacterium]